MNAPETRHLHYVPIFGEKDWDGLDILFISCIIRIILQR